MIPNNFHFVFGMASDFGGKPFSLIHYISIKSAIKYNNPDKIYFHYQYEPSGEWWKKIKPELTLNQIKAPKEIFGNPLLHVAHQADIVRLQVLLEFGGIYMDLDTICVKPMTDLLRYECVMGYQINSYIATLPKGLFRSLKLLRRKILYPYNKPEVSGLCNGIILSAKNSEFISSWLNTYSNFRSKGRDKFWAEHSVLIPSKLSAKLKDKIHILDEYSFHYPPPSENLLSTFFEENLEYPSSYIHHLWETVTWANYLRDLTIDKIKSEKGTFYRLCREILDLNIS